MDHTLVFVPSYFDFVKVALVVVLAEVVVAVGTVTVVVVVNSSRSNTDGWSINRSSRSRSTRSSFTNVLTLGEKLVQVVRPRLLGDIGVQ